MNGALRPPGRCSAMPNVALAAILAIVVSTSSSADNTPTISLTDSIRGVLRIDNDAIRLQDEKVKTASANVKQAAGAFDWTAQVQGGWQELYVPRALPGVVPGKAVLTNNTDTLNALYYSASIGREFRNGIQVAPGVTAYPSTGGATTAQTFGLTVLRPSLGLRIPLLQGLGEEAADAAELAAKATLTGTRFDRDYAIAHTVHDLVQTYWRCLAADQIAQISAQSVRDGDEFYSTLKLQVERGMLEPTVAQRSVAGNVTRTITLDQNQDAARSCRRDLALATTGEALGSAPQAAGEMPSPSGIDSAIAGLNEAALDDMALDNRSDLKAAREYIASALAARKGTENGTSPTLSLQIDPTRAIVVYSQSLQNDAAEGKDAAALSSERQAQIALHQLESQVKVNIGDEVRNIRSALAEWKAASDAERKTEKVVSDAVKRARYGVTDRSDLLAARDQLTQIQSQVVNARLQFASGVTSLRLETGTVHPEQETPAASAAKFSTLPTSS